MADNLPVTPGTGATVAADEIGGVLHQRVKLSLGVDGAAADAVGGAGASAPGVQRMTLASDDPAVVELAALGRIVDGDYETVAAGQTNQALGAGGAVGDYLMGVLIVPATTSPGVVQIKDGSNSAITVFAGGPDSISNLVPFLVPLGIRSVSGAWQVTTGADVSVVASGSFT
jgi:hypothetical protein